MADGEETVLENQLELQLTEQKDSLSALNDALASDPSNAELLAVREELVEAMKDAEEGLLNLKRSRLLREADSALNVSNQAAFEEVKVEALDPNDVEVEPLEEQGRNFRVGSKCRFRYTDGRWYDGQIVASNDSDSSKISFLTPTSETMLICKFFLQQRCRFGANCRLSHGVDVPLSSLKKYAPTIWEPSMVGSSIWALSDTKVGIWREAELESWNDELRMGKVVFRDTGSSAELAVEALALSEFAQVSDEEDSELSSEESDSSDYEEESPRGLGFTKSTALQRGIQTETILFAKWENHTRGVASKMMANMGYCEGMGLGATGQGMVDPISVKILPPKLSLDHAVESRKSDESKEKKGKKRSRGGKRKREKKFAEASRAAKDEEESRPDVFSLINDQLAMHSEAVNGVSAKKNQNKGSGEEKKVDRKALVAYDDEVKELRLRVAKLEEMMSRNRKEKAVYEAAMRKLNETRKALAEAEAAHASASNAVVSKEKEKKWLKF
ncbi:hypothetical protein DITRI_Ditri03aG0009100 [Diplodiscus trichospermus]